jgi:hypothetical protein
MIFDLTGGYLTFVKYRTFCNLDFVLGFWRVIIHFYLDL